MRQCTLMRLGQGLKYRDIAAALQVSTETVKVQLHQARKRLAERLCEHFTELEP
jgi:DNA-directed RNA polymerase specialized sigma24 family protein